MFTIQLTVCVALLFAISSAIPSPGQHVFSAIIHNKQSIPTRCTITWEFDNAPMPDRDTFTIASNDAKLVNERIIDMGSWTARAFIQEIECGGLSVTHPFRGVDSFEMYWNFDIQPTEILSVGPSEEKPLDE